MTTASDIEAAAAEWLVRLDSLDEDETPPADFLAWCDSDPRHRAAYLRLEAAWKRADRLGRMRGFDGSVDVDLLAAPARAVQPRPASRRLLWPAAAAAMALVAGITGWLLEQRGQVHRTGVGGFERIVLADGSAVELNTDSEIRVRLTASARRISLLRGQANFKVAHDAQRPFDVVAGATTVRAVGTTFAVRLRDRRQVEVMVAEGRVAIAGQDMDLSSVDVESRLPTLGAGEVAVIEPGMPAIDTRQVQTEDIGRRLAWTEGLLMFDGQTLGEAVAEFNRYNRRQLSIADPEITALRVGGSFSATDPESFAVALQRSFGIRVSTVDPQRIVLARSRD